MSRRHRHTRPDGAPIDRSSRHSGARHEPSPTPERQSRAERLDEGFTLIELIIVIAILPIVVGALAVGIVSVLTLQTKVSNRLTDSGDAEVVAAHFQNDMQSAALITTSNAPTSSPAGTTMPPVAARVSRCWASCSATTRKSPTRRLPRGRRTICSETSVSVGTRRVPRRVTRRPLVHAHFGRRDRGRRDPHGQLHLGQDQWWRQLHGRVERAEPHGQQRGSGYVRRERGRHTHTDTQPVATLPLRSQRA